MRDLCHFTYSSARNDQKRHICCNRHSHVPSLQRLDSNFFAVEKVGSRSLFVSLTEFCHTLNMCLLTSYGCAVKMETRKPQHVLVRFWNINYESSSKFKLSSMKCRGTWTDTIIQFKQQIMQNYIKLKLLPHTKHPVSITYTKRLMCCRETTLWEW